MGRGEERWCGQQGGQGSGVRGQGGFRVEKLNNLEDKGCPSPRCPTAWAGGSGVLRGPAS